MTGRFSRLALFGALAVLLAVSVAWAQVSTAGRLTGAVTDSTGASIVGADVTVKEEATGAEIKTKSGSDGSFTVGNLKPGTYTVTVAFQGFKSGQFREVKIVLGATYALKAVLEVGPVESTVVIEAGAEVLQTAQTTIETTITGKAIQQLPFTSRDALDLGVLMPGAQTTGRPRNTSFQGLPKGAINITLDGINAQDNINKTSDGFFTTMRPRVDSIEEFSISTAAQGAEQAAEGAVQIRFETKRGGNEFHGGVWWYHRNDFLNSNYYFNNLAGRPRDRQRLNQYGYKVGGPIWKDKLFFFHAFDFYRRPESRTRDRTLLTSEAVSGQFRYAATVPATLPAWVTCNAPAGMQGQCVANILQMAGANGFQGTRDTVLAPLLDALGNITSVPGVNPVSTATPLFQRAVRFANSGGSDRYFPDFRFDWRVTSNHEVSVIYHYNLFYSTPDFLNSRDFTYPVAPFNTNQASQNSNRNEFVGQWRWNVATNKSNLLIFGVVSAPVAFFNDMSPDIYPQVTTNLGQIRVRPTLFGFSTQPWLPFGAFPRNTAIGQLNDTFSWTKGRHSTNWGFTITQIHGGIQSSDSAVATLPMSTVAATDTLRGIFVSSNLPGTTATDRVNARNLYATLTGRATSYSGLVYVDIASRQFATGVPLQENYRQNEFGFFGTDSWRIHPTLTLNYGLRWEYQGSPYGTDNIYFDVGEGETGAFGVSGVGNLFKPGVIQGNVPVYKLHGNGPWYGKDLNNWAPSVGLAWSPRIDHPWYNMVFGGPGKTVFRGGYSVSYTREGTANWLSIVEANPGFFGNQFASASTSGVPGTFLPGSVRLQNLTVNGVAQDPPAFVDTFPLDPATGNSVNSYQRDLRVPYVQSWSIGIQREITPDTVLEVRYVGNHAPNLWRQVDLNEANVFENGFMDEFLDAQSNLAIFRAANPTCGQANQISCSFGNRGLAGQVPLPIMSAALLGITPAQLAANPTLGGTDANFDNGANADLDDGEVGGFASLLAFDLALWQNLVGAGFDENFWVVNPQAFGGAFLFANGGRSSYNALVVEVRRRLSKGVQLNGNYVWSKSLTNLYHVSGASFDQPDTLRNVGRDKGPAPWDIRHAFKFHGIWELPFGPGRKWSSGQGWLNRVIEGWEVSAIARIQSGRVTRLTSGFNTFNQFDGGVNFTGITEQELQEQSGLRRLPTGQVFYLPANLIGSDGRANEAFLGPCRTPGRFCQRAFVYGPNFVRPDINIVKRTHVTERVNIEFRAEFLNAFNNVNFFFGGTSDAQLTTHSVFSSTFGSIPSGQAYRDSSTTDDPGGRQIQIVLRVNF